MKCLLAACVLTTGLTFAQEGRFERTLSVSGNVDLDVVTDAGGIVVTPGPAGSIQIRGILKAQRGWMGGSSADIEARIRRLEQNPPVHQSGNTIQAGHVAKDALRGISMRLEIVSPPNTKVHARADSGGIRVEGMRGPVDCQTDSGGIHIRNVQGPVYARADSGGIEALEVAGSIDAQTDSGGIHLAQTKPDSIRAKADSGGAHVKLVSGAGYDVRASADSGSVNVSDITAHGTISRNHMEGKVRGGGPLVDVHTSSGTVTID